MVSNFIFPFRHQMADHNCVLKGYQGKEDLGWEAAGEAFCPRMVCRDHLPIS